MKKKSLKSVPAILIITGLCLFYIISCKDQETGSGEKLTAEQAAQCNTRLTRQKIADAWGPEELKSIQYLVFYSSFDRMTQTFNVVVRAFKSDNSAVGNYVALSQNTDCTFDFDNVAIGENIIDLKDLEILEGNGSLKNFDYIKLTPQVYPKDDSFVNFDVDVYTGGVGGETKSFTLPCPPCYYCRPIPPDCSYDTTINQDTLEGIQTPAISQ